MKVVVRTVHLAQQIRPQHAVGKQYGLSAHSCRGMLNKHCGRVVASAMRSSHRGGLRFPGLAMPPDALTLVFPALQFERPQLSYVRRGFVP